MLVLGLLFLPLLAWGQSEITKDEFLITIDNGILRSILPQGNAMSERKLDVSEMGIREIERQAFDNLVELESLNLANNSLTRLPEFIFANLTKLKSLCLAGNRITSLENLLVGLQNLQYLDISYTLIRHLRRGHLFSLSQPAEIITVGNTFYTLSNVAFDNPFLKNDAESLEYERKRFDEHTIDLEAGEASGKRQLLSFAINYKADSIIGEREILLDTKIRVKLCAEDGVVNSLELLEKDELLSEKCMEISVDHVRRRISLSNLGIKDFDRDWYRLQKLRILELDLSKNDISEVTSELLNDLPGDLISVNLMGNRITKIKKLVIENDHLKTLVLANNAIEEIEEGAFEHTKLTELFLTKNNLRLLQFGKTLPSTLTALSLASNRMKNISEDAFPQLSNLIYLNLEENMLGHLQKNTFRGLRSLNVLDITKNQLSSIEPGAFRGLHSLQLLQLFRNRILKLEKGTFEGLASLKTLNLGWNKLRNITRMSFADLPMSLDSLYLDFNEIEYLGTSSFTSVPRITLSLDGNRISSIPKAAFDLPFLQNLHLHNNSLKALDADAYIRMPYLKKLWLGDNQIAKIEKGATRNLGYLTILDISRNPIKKLEDGVFYGLPKYRGHFVYFAENRIELIQTGLYEDY